jgi:hypothetical protein
VRHDPLRLDRLLQVAWHLYFDPEMPTQIEIARLVGLSDSSISDYRRRLELELGAIRIGLKSGPILSSRLRRDFHSAWSGTAVAPGTVRAGAGDSLTGRPAAGRSAPHKSATGPSRPPGGSRLPGGSDLIDQEPRPSHLRG